MICPNSQALTAGGRFLAPTRDAIARMTAAQMVAYAIKVLNDPLYRGDEGHLDIKRVVGKPDLEAIRKPGGISLDRAYGPDALEPVPTWLERQLPEAFDADATIEADGFKETVWEAASKWFGDEIVEHGPPEPISWPWTREQRRDAPKLGKAARSSRYTSRRSSGALSGWKLGRAARAKPARAKTRPARAKTKLATATPTRRARGNRAPAAVATRSVRGRAGAASGGARWPYHRGSPRGRRAAALGSLPSLVPPRSGPGVLQSLDRY